MDFLKQLWSNSRAFRVVAAVAIAGLVLAVITSSRSPSSRHRAEESSPNESVVGRIRDRVTGGGLAGKARRTTENAIDTADQAIETGGKVINATGRAVDKAADAVGIGKTSR